MQAPTPAASFALSFRAISSPKAVAFSRSAAVHSCEDGGLRSVELDGRHLRRRGGRFWLAARGDQATRQHRRPPQRHPVHRGTVRQPDRPPQPGISSPAHAFLPPTRPRSRPDDAERGFPRRRHAERRPPLPKCGPARSAGCPGAASTPSFAEALPPPFSDARRPPHRPDAGNEGGHVQPRQFKG